LAALLLSAPAGAQTRLSLQPGGEADRLLIDSAEVVPLIRGVSGRFSVTLKEPAPPLAQWPRGMTGITRQPQGFSFDLASGIHLVYRTTAQGTAINFVHRLGGGPTPPAAPVAATGPLPARQVSVGLVFTAPRLALIRIGPTALLVLPPGADLDLAGLPPRPVRSAEEVLQGRHRIIRLGLDAGAGLELAREGAGVWRLGFAAGAAPARGSAAFGADARSVRLDGLGAGAEAVSLRLPELGTVAVVLTDTAVGLPGSRSPWLEVMPAEVGALVVPRSEALVMVKDGSALVFSAVDQSR